MGDYSELRPQTLPGDKRCTVAVPLLLLLAAIDLPPLPGTAAAQAEPARVTAATTPDLVRAGNRWTFKTSGTTPPYRWPAPQSICFEYAGSRGQHQHYTWYSDTFPGWRGTATQEGERIHLSGEYAGGLGYSAIQMEIPAHSPGSAPAGYWQEWRNDAAYAVSVGSTPARAQRDGDCRISAAQAAAQAPKLDGNPLTAALLP